MTTDREGWLRALKEAGLRYERFLAAPEVAPFLGYPEALREHAQLLSAKYPEHRLSSPQFTPTERYRTYAALVKQGDREAAQRFAAEDVAGLRTGEAAFLEGERQRRNDAIRRQGDLDVATRRATALREDLRVTKLKVWELEHATVPPAFVAEGLDLARRKEARLTEELAGAEQSIAALQGAK